MFNGIIETIGTLSSIEIKQGCKVFTIKPQHGIGDLSLGESIAVNGVCLTVTDFTPHTFNVTVVPETLSVTNLDRLNQGSKVNLERALKANARISGHYVQGHVDGVGTLLKLKHDQGQALLATISTPPTLDNYLVDKGFIALDGMSITIIRATASYFTVTFIPHTQDVTIINHYREGDGINIEVDIMGKYIKKLLGVYAHAIPH
jgi:riboflavin synthase